MAWSTGLEARTACRLLGYDSCSVLPPDPAHRVLAIEGALGHGEAPSSRTFRTGRAAAIETARLWDREQRTALLERPALFEGQAGGAHARQAATPAQPRPGAASPRAARTSAGATPVDDAPP
ncbi:hypothetical protein [Streptomyces canarius]